MDEDVVLGAREIRAQFAEALSDLGATEMNYIEFYGWLRKRGFRPKGNWPKECHRSIYNAFTGREDIVKVAPGVFKFAEGPKG